MPDNDDKISRAIFIHVAAIAISAPYVAAVSQQAQTQAVRQLDQERLAEALGVEWSGMTETAIAAEALLLHERGRGANRRRVYTLGFSGSGAENQPELFDILSYFEKTGSLMTMGRVRAPDLAGYLRQDAPRWRDLLRDLRDRSEAADRTLDRNRYEQLLHAIAALDMICADSAGAAIATASWSPMRLVAEELSAGGGETLLRAVVQNDNIIDAPVPALRVPFGTNDGVPLGFWLVFPSDAVIPANGEIEIRGRLQWPEDGVASGGVALVSDAADYASARNTDRRFPGGGGDTWID